MFFVGGAYPIYAGLVVKCPEGSKPAADAGGIQSAQGWSGVQRARRPTVVSMRESMVRSRRGTRPGAIQRQTLIWVGLGRGRNALS